MIQLIPTLWLAGCVGLQGMDPEQACLEAGYAIASQTYSCTGDGDAANARYEDFMDTFTCVPHDLVDEGPVKLNPQADLFHCAFMIRTLDCDTVDLFGDDLTRWMQVSPACSLIATYADGSPLPSYDPDLIPDGDLPGEEDIPCSADLGGAATVVITNNGLTDVQLFWRDGACDETPYGTISSRSSFTQPTYEGHVWTVRSLQGGLLTWFEASPGLTVEVP